MRGLVLFAVRLAPGEASSLGVYGAGGPRAPVYDADAPIRQSQFGCLNVCPEPAYLSRPT
jgi:hypothetical protein